MSLGSEYDRRTSGWAARWNTISGRAFRKKLSSSSEFRISAIFSHSRISPTPASRYAENSVSGKSEYPQTFAPSAFSHRESHEPLKPACPVTRTLFPLKTPPKAMAGYSQIFHGARPEFQSSLSSFLSLSMSIGRQNPPCM